MTCIWVVTFTLRIPNPP